MVFGFNNDKSKVDMLNFFYPVGSYYETSDTLFNPNTTWGGTWELEVEGQVHISAGTNYEVEGALTNTTDGGEKSHDHLYALQYGGYYGETIIENNANAGVINYRTGLPAGGGASVGSSSTNANNSTTTSNKAVSPAHYKTEGYTSEFSNMQPYIVVNRWHRTA